MTIRFILVLTLFIGCACVCLANSNRLILASYTTIFIVTISTLLAASLLKPERDFFLIGFSVVCLLYFELDSRSQWSIADELGVIFPFGIESWKAGYPAYSPPNQSRYIVEVPYHPGIVAATVFRSVLAIIAGLIGGTVCQWIVGKSKIEG